MFLTVAKELLPNDGVFVTSRRTFCLKSGVKFTKTQVNSSTARERTGGSRLARALHVAVLPGILRCVLSYLILRSLSTRPTSLVDRRAVQLAIYVPILISYLL